MKLRTKKKNQPEISTSALPDIVFLLLFFFMVSATIRPPEELIKPKLPGAAAITKIDRKELVREIYMGAPKRDVFGEEPKIAVDKRFIELSEIASWAIAQREQLPEALQDQMIVILRADETVPMGLISDVQEELKKVNARKLVFRTIEE